MLNRRISNKRISKDSGNHCRLLVPEFRSRMIRLPAGGWTNLKERLWIEVRRRDFNRSSPDH